MILRETEFKDIDFMIMPNASEKFMELTLELPRPIKIHPNQVVGFYTKSMDALAWEFSKVS